MRRRMNAGVATSLLFHANVKPLSLPEAIRSRGEHVHAVKSLPGGYELGTVKAFAAS